MGDRRKLIAYIFFLNEMGAVMSAVVVGRWDKANAECQTDAQTDAWAEAESFGRVMDVSFHIMSVIRKVMVVT